MIRLTISCDICRAEKKETNRWFVVCEQNGELRVGGWNARFRNKATTRHLCGQTCLYKFLDEFMAQMIADGRAAESAEQAAEVKPVVTAPRIAATAIAATEMVAQRATDASLISSSAYEYEDEFGSSARLIPTPEPVSDAPLRIVPQTARVEAEPSPVVLKDDSPKFQSHQWRAAAWERERARGMRAESASRRKGA